MRRNPNHYGSVVKLSGNRRRPFLVRSGVYGYNDKGHPISNIIGYAATREEANIMLANYNHNPWNIDKSKITLEELFVLWKEKKAPKLGASNRNTLISIYKHCAKLSKLPYKAIKAYQMQETIDFCKKSYSTQAHIKNLWSHLDKFALELDITNTNYSVLLTSAPVPPTSRLPFTQDEINILWKHAAQPWVDTVLILIYSGWRISEFLALKPEDVDIQAGTMKGGTKTKAGKNRIVPIHSKIRPFIEARLAEGGPRLISHSQNPLSEHIYRTLFSSIMSKFHMKHTPHECRHTFETLLDSAGANRKCIDLMMGHVSKDVGNRIYNHKTLEELKFNIELITN